MKYSNIKKQQASSAEKGKKKVNYLKKLNLFRDVLINRSLYIAQKYKLNGFDEVQEIVKAKLPALNFAYQNYPDKISSIAEEVNERLSKTSEEVPMMISSLVSLLTKINGLPRKSNTRRLNVALGKLNIQTDGVFIQPSDASTVLFKTERLYDKQKATGYLRQKINSNFTEQDLEDLIYSKDVLGISVDSKVYVRGDDIENYIIREKASLLDRISEIEDPQERIDMYLSLIGKDSEEQTE